MDIKKIKQLAQLFNQSNLSALEISEGETKIRMERSSLIQAPEPQLLPQATAQPLVQVGPTPPIAQPREKVVDFNRLTEVKAPMIGVFYAAPSPDAQPFVRRGDRVKKGDVLCLIEAMKLLNEIVAEADGEIADICVQNGQLVEFSQTLFKLF